KAKVAVFSLEMGKEQLSQRMLGSTALVELGKLSTGDLQEEDWKRLVEAGKVLSGTSIYIDDTAGITLLELKAKCRNLKMSEGLDLVVIDYLQLMSADGRIENRQQEISKISRGL
ncbi:replicative DNA helicase, partial [Bacillus licheniformis]|uniref:DnaB-like helicase C-terminal domain-containing protein n=1 Tax=Bacillus licheniformis TaxID=1402 RepID=UPI000F9E6561